MTSLHTTQTASQNPRAFRLPDIPEKHPDDMTSFKHLAKGGNVSRIESWLGNPETTIVSGERYICAAPGGPIRYPDLLVAFNADPELYEANNGYVVSLSGQAAGTGAGDRLAATPGAPTLRSSRTSTPAWGCGNTGALTRPESFTAPDWLATGWSTVGTGPSRWTNCPMENCGDTAKPWGCTSAGGRGRLDWYDPSAEDYIPSLEFRAAVARAGGREGTPAGGGTGSAWMTGGQAAARAFVRERHPIAAADGFRRARDPAATCGRWPAMAGNRPAG